jgi:hypothetical protein
LPDSFGNTPLYYACHYGHAAVAELLVEHGCVDDAVRRCWRNALDRGSLPTQIRKPPRQARPAAPCSSATPAELREARRQQRCGRPWLEVCHAPPRCCPWGATHVCSLPTRARTLAMAVGVDEGVARAMLFGASPFHLTLRRRAPSISHSADVR